MTTTRIKTENKNCRKCKWCSKMDAYDILANTHTPVYYCIVGDFYSKKSPAMTPTLKNDCPCSTERYKDDEDDE